MMKWSQKYIPSAPTLLGGLAASLALGPQLL